MVFGQVKERKMIMHFNIDKAYREGLEIVKRHAGHDLQAIDIVALRNMKPYDCIVTAFYLGVRQGWRIRKKHGEK